MVLGRMHTGIAGLAPDSGVDVYTQSPVLCHNGMTPYKNHHRLSIVITFRTLRQLEELENKPALSSI
jgi:hypothetical protein